MRTQFFLWAVVVYLVTPGLLYAHQIHQSELVVQELPEHVWQLELRFDPHDLPFFKKLDVNQNQFLETDEFLFFKKDMFDFFSRGFGIKNSQEIKKGQPCLELVPLKIQLLESLAVLDIAGQWRCIDPAMPIIELPFLRFLSVHQTQVWLKQDQTMKKIKRLHARDYHM